MFMIIFDGWAGLMRVIVSGVAAYAYLLVILRMSGKRTLSKMNAFDFIVTIALGSTISAIILQKSVPLVEGGAALALLVLLQFVITWLSVRFAFVSNLVKAEPTLLAKDGHLLHDAMRRQRVTREEVEAAIRQHGLHGIGDPAMVILETDGSMSVISSSKEGGRGEVKAKFHDQSAS
jgi:uncharacterized membrane protein YcaP (DUF421 family)